MRIRVIGIAIMLLAVSATCHAQMQSASSGQKSLAATMDVYVFPTTGQSSEQQSKDEATCYQWAVQNTGTDPFQLQQQQATEKQQAAEASQQAAQVGEGSGVRGAARGAAAGALVGGIADDHWGKGAAWGAAIGGLAARRRGHMAQEEATQQVQAQSQEAQQATQEQMTNFKKAFSVCLEAKKYMVKY